MSFKKISCLAVLAALVASPVWAQATLSLELARSAGIIDLDANGNYQWVLSVDMTNAGAVGVEAAIDFGDGVILGATQNMTNFDTDNPGNQIYSWEALTGTPAKPEGLQFDPTDMHEATINLGSVDFASSGVYEVATFITSGPDANVATSLNPTATLLGAYDGSGNLLGATGTFAFAGTGDATPNNKTYSNGGDGAMQPILAGDIDLDGDVDIDDGSFLVSNFGNLTGQVWGDGDLDKDGDVDIDDGSFLVSNFGSGGPPAPGPIATGAPEPTTALLALLASGFGLCVRRRS